MEEKNEESNDTILDFQRNLFIGFLIFFVLATIILIIYSFFLNN